MRENTQVPLNVQKRGGHAHRSPEGVYGNALREEFPAGDQSFTFLQQARRACEDRD